jgi:thiosulfate/3-mercaptopyruvate sulfurtransferase
MRRKILYTPGELNAVAQAGGCVIADCRHELARPEIGREHYLESHIPGALYAHLEEDLSSAITATSGRHPLPDPDAFAAFLARCGWSPGKLLVAYDDAGGAIASRLWWLMKYFGHDCGALLDGGIDAWRNAGFELETGCAVAVPATAIKLNAQSALVVSTAEIARNLPAQEFMLVDARAAKRFRGEVEPIDPVAGHVPGAINYPYAAVLTPEGRFKPVEEIRRALQRLSGKDSPATLVHMCGSGVTACLNLFAAELAGLPAGQLYAGSWSEWCRDPSRPVEP